MKEFKKKPCSNCINIFLPTGPAAKYCEKCSSIIRAENIKKAGDKYRLKLGQEVGIGSGGCNKKLQEDNQYKNGISFLRENRKRIKDLRRYCERCTKDLTNVKSSLWCVHHKDRNRSNNLDSNLELLCKRCHQIEHDCHKALRCNDHL